MGKMTTEQWQEEGEGQGEAESAVESEPQATSPGRHPAPLRLWLERIGIGLIAVISLMVPLLVGLLFYLAVTDGLVINANDPFHEIRLWMVQERRGATGLGLTITTPRGSAGAAQCAFTSATFLKWDGGLRVERASDYCRCYVNKGGQLVERAGDACQ